MRFATLVAVAFAVSSTPSLAAPTLFAPHRANSTHLAHHGHAANGTAANLIHPAHHNPHHAHHGHAANASAANSTQASKRAVTSDIVQAIEAALDSLPLARKRDVITTALQELESLGLSKSASTIDKRLKLPKISPSTESAISNAANVATIGGGIAKVWDALDGSSSSSKRDYDVSKVWDGIAEVFDLNRGSVPLDKRALKTPASVTTWLKSLGNVASIGAGGAAIVGAVDGGSNNAKRLLDECGVQTFPSIFPDIYNLTEREPLDALHGVDIATLLNGEAPQFKDRSIPSLSDIPPYLRLACA